MTKQFGLMSLVALVVVSRFWSRVSRLVGVNPPPLWEPSVFSASGRSSYCSGPPCGLRLRTTAGIAQIVFGGDVLDAVGVNLDQELQPWARIELRLDGCLADAGDATGSVERLPDLIER